MHQRVDAVVRERFGRLDLRQGSQELVHAPSSKRPKGLFSEFDVQHRHDRSSVSGDDDRLVRGSVQNGAQSRLCIMRCDGRGHGMFGELKTTYAESSRSQDPEVLPLKRLSVFTVFDFKKAAALPWVASARGRNYPQRLPPAAFVLSSF